MSDNGEKVVVGIHDDDDDDESIDEEQLAEYKDMVEQLGSFPDKVKINSLSMVAEDHAESRKNASAIYSIIKAPLLDPSSSRDRKLPLVYVVDSILKNVKGTFLKIIEEDAKNWMPIVFNGLTPEQREKLRKVWKLWRDNNVFDEASWKEMGSCFTNAGVAKLAVSASAATNTVAGIPRATDGTLQLKASLRKEMQALLDEAQSEVTNELDKVSLERLADINPDLLSTLKANAEDMLGASANGQHNASNGPRGGSIAQKGSTNSEGSTQAGSTPPFLVETRPSHLVERSVEWHKLKWDRQIQAPKLVAQLHQSVQTILGSDKTYSQADAVQMTITLATANVVAQHLTNELERFQQQETRSNGHSATNSRSTGARKYTAVDKSLFTNEGIKQKDSTVIGLLYEIGLPFVSASDGRRFATQLELSKHLDYLFKKTQLEKSMERTEERGWFAADAFWTMDKKDINNSKTSLQIEDHTKGSSSGGTDHQMQSKFAADETRDRCVICGIKFKMMFEADEGIYQYTNCREIKVLNDEAAATLSENMLVHWTCWQGLGSPDELSSDQILHDYH